MAEGSGQELAGRDSQPTNGQSPGAKAASGDPAPRSSDVDVAVVGGGPVGAAAALGLADAGRRVALIEQRQPQAQVGSLGMDLRTLALSPASQALLADLGLWVHLQPTPYRAMQVWEERGTAAIRFEAADVDRTELGWMQEYGPLAQAAWQRLGEHANVELIVGQAPSLVEPQSDAVVVQVGGRQLRAALLIAADGAQSEVREQLGVKARAQDTGQVALVGVVRTTSGHDGTAWQRFLHDGPLALLPGRDERTAALVWSQSPSAGARRLAMAEGAFCAELTRLSEACMGEICALDRRLTFPLVQSVAASFNPHPRVLLIGDAARVVHLMAGLGLNLGFEDVTGLLRTVQGALDPGAPGLWRTFARRRKARAQAMVRMLSTLQGFYAIKQPALQWLRNSGVRMVNGLAPLKRQIIMEAMGLGPLATRLS